VRENVIDDEHIRKGDTLTALRSLESHSLTNDRVGV